jgi:hypothetical protein
VLGRDGHQLDRRRKGRGLPPVELGDRGDARPPEDGAQAQADEEARVVALVETPQSGQVEVVVVGVADEDDVDGRQVLEAHAGGAVAARADPGEGAGPLGPDRIGEHVEPVLLEEHRRVVDVGDAHVAHPFGRPWAGRAGALLPARWVAGPLPAQEGAEAGVRHLAQVMEPLAVEVIGGGAAPGSHGQRKPDQQPQRHRRAEQPPDRESGGDQQAAQRAPSGANHEARSMARPAAAGRSGDSQ